MIYYEQYNPWVLFETLSYQMWRCMHLHLCSILILKKNTDISGKNSTNFATFLPKNKVQLHKYSATSLNNMLNSSPIWEWDHNFNHQILDNTSCIANFFFQNIVIGIKCQNMDMRACGLCSVDYVDAWSLMFFTKTFIRLVAVVMSMVVWATLLLLALQLSKKWTFYYVSGGGFLWRWWTNNRWGAWRFEG